MSFCNKCGYKLDPGDKFCFECGSPVREIKPAQTADTVKLPEQKTIGQIHTAEQQENTAVKTAKKSFNKKPLIISLCVIGSFILIGLIVAICCSPSNKGIKQLAPQHFDFSPDTQIGETIVFGKYEQNANASDGKEDIEWIVLDKEGNKALIISKYALDDKQFNSTGGDVTWDTSTLRVWLNGAFFDDAFTIQDQKRIVSTIIEAEKHQRHISVYGTNTNDKVFLLSSAEVNKYFTTEEARKCIPAEYLKPRFEYWKSKKTGQIICSWWTRSPGFQHNAAVVVDDDGVIETEGVNAVRNYAIRPAIWIDLGS